MKTRSCAGKTTRSWRSMQKTCVKFELIDALSGFESSSRSSQGKEEEVHFQNSEPLRAAVHAQWKIVSNSGKRLKR